MKTMNRLCLLAMTLVMMSGCVAQEAVTVKPALLFNNPMPHPVLFQLKDKVYPNVNFCGVSMEEILKSYLGVSITAAGRVVYAFNLFKQTEHPDAWAIVFPDKTGNRWPHMYQFDMDGNGTAELQYQDLERNGKCLKLVIMNGKEKTL